MIPEEERKAVLSLYPYFNRDGAVVIDVGSNKGEWADTLIHNVKMMYLIEPNERLLTYTRVKYDYLQNVMYLNHASMNYNGRVEFSYFNDKHNGLSNVFHNPKWEYLLPSTETVPCVRLDDLFISDIIDFIKIDCEGADFFVLQGSEKLLSQRRVKFLSFENSEHLSVAGHSLQMIIDYVRFFGYDVFHFNGLTFTKQIDEKAENLYIMDENFSYGWNKEFIENTRGMKFDFVLEIGCFEGLTSKYICENLLKPGGRMVCVDPLTDEYLPGHKDNAMFVGQYERFKRNTNNLPVELIRKTSADAYDQMYHYRFGLVYVDGDHREDQVYQDAKRAFFLCLAGGYILFDDYDGYDGGTKRGIDKFVSELAAEKFSVIKKGYQLLLQKHENLI